MILLKVVFGWGYVSTQEGIEKIAITLKQVVFSTPISQISLKIKMISRGFGNLDGKLLKTSIDSSK